MLGLMSKKGVQRYRYHVASWMALVVLLIAAHGCTCFALRPKNMMRTVLHTVPRADSVGSKEFSDAMDQVTDTTATDANRVRLLTNGREAFPAMLAAIDRAKHCISMEFYKIRMDRVGECFVRALTRAAQRGVQVRFLYDA